MTAASGLFDSERHLAVTNETWNEQGVRCYLQELLDGIREGQKPDGRWPDELAEFSLSLYAGVAGIAWAQDQLQQRDYVVQHQPGLCSSVAGNIQDLAGDRALFEEYQVPVSHSFYLGSSGIQLQMWKETGDACYLDTLETLIVDNQAHPWMENLWGAPSTMLVASHLLAATGEERFAEHIRSGARYMEERLQAHPDVDCEMWDIDLYGERTWLLGAGHGFAGNAFPILKSSAVFDETSLSRWRDRIMDTAMRTAQCEEGLANWRQSIGNARKGRDDMLVQQCHGAPGFIIALSCLMGHGHTQFDELMMDAGELVWRAGPLNKYPGLCHGTPGNGYAFLKLFEKTGDSMWLSRARIFAMSSIAQHERVLASGAARAYGLWEGDAGMAVFLADCIDARADFPTLDYF
jgi:hypothetical protein